MTLNMDAVDLLLDCRTFNFETFPEGMVHTDGRPFTDEEIATVGKATMAELRAVTDYQSKVIEHNREQLRLIAELTALTKPYFERYGKHTTLGDIYQLMTPMDAALYEYILSRLDRFA